MRDSSTHRALLRTELLRHLVLVVASAAILLTAGSDMWAWVGVAVYAVLHGTFLLILQCGACSRGDSEGQIEQEVESVMAPEAWQATWYSGSARSLSTKVRQDDGDFNNGKAVLLG